MDRQRFTGSIGIGITAAGYDRVDEDVLKMAEYQRFIDRKEMMEYFLQPENDDEETKKEPIVTNKLINITKLKKDIKNPDLYETANVCHVCHMSASPRRRFITATIRIQLYQTPVPQNIL